MEHNGITIQFNDSNGKFTARKNGEELSSTSLAGIKKKLDTKDLFEPFDILYERYIGTGYHEARVVGIKKARKGSEWRGDEWLIQSTMGGDTRTSVIEDTPANRKLIEQLKAKQKEREEIKERLDKEYNAISAKITRRSPPKRGQ